jgi:hypothetical protein
MWLGFLRDSAIIVCGALPGCGRKGGRQGKGREAGRLQEPDEACNLLAHHTQDHQANELIGACLGLPLVEPESRAAIGARRKQAPLLAGSEDVRRQPCGDGCSSDERGSRVLDRDA